MEIELEYREFEINYLGCPGEREGKRINFELEAIKTTMIRKWSFRL